MRRRDIIAASPILGFSFLSIMVLVARFHWVHKIKNDPDANNACSNDRVEQQTSLLSRDRSWVRLFAPKRERGHWMPTLSGVIKAGDEGVYSSALFKGLLGPLGELLLEQLYDAFANELRARPTAERSTYPSEISKFLSTTRRLRRGQSLRATKHGRTESQSRPPLNSIDLAEMGLSRSRSRRPAPILVSTFNVLPHESGSQSPMVGLWAQELQHALYSDGRTNVQVSVRELAALSVILGSSVDLALDTKDREKTERRPSMGRGAFGVSISGMATDDGNYHISLPQHKRSITQLPAKGSGYSTLHAKHLASGSLPFSLDKKTVNSILITTETLESLKSGTPLDLQKSGAQTNASKFLTSLPNSREPTFHILTPSTTLTSTPLLLHAIAALPFTGGVTPLVSAPLVKTVQFIACGGLVAGRLLQRLDALVEKVHRQSPHLQLFGPILEDSNAGLLYRERERLGMIAAGAIANEPLADKVARMHRFITMLERLMALVPDMKPSEVLAAVKEATQKEIERSYEDAVAAHTGNNKDAESSITAESNRRSTLSQRSARRSKRSSTSSIGVQTPTSLTSPRSSSTFPPNNLGRQVEGVLKGSLPFDVRTIALVARMVLVAWTQSVEAVAWGEGEEGFSAMPEKMCMW